MSKSKKVISLMLVAVMVIGASLTALAAESAQAKTDEQKAQEISAQVDNNVTIASGTGTVTVISDTATLAVGYDMGLEADSTVASIADQFTETPSVVATLLFDVEGVAGGDVTIQASASYAGKLGVATHYNSTTGQIETMSDLVEFDSQGRATVHFNSYSPVLIRVLNVTRDSIKEDSTVGVKTVNLAAPTVTAASSVKTAKMGE